MNLSPDIISSWTTQTQTLNVPLSTYEGLELIARQFCKAAIDRYFLESGLFSSERELSFDSVCEKLKVIAPFHRFINRLLHIMQEEGVLSEHQGVWKRCSQTPIKPSVQQVLTKFTLFQPAFLPFFSFLEKVMRSYPEVLSGSLPASALLYPQGDASTLASLHAITPPVGSESMCLALAHRLIRYLSENQEHTLKILEIGGGQGILTDILATLCGSYIDSYTFTDISRSLVSEASQKYSKITQFSFATFDITTTPPFEPSSFDLIVAYNVIHAAPNIYSALQSLSSLLVPHGALINIELVDCPPWIELLYGITREWNSYTDQIRNSSPLLRPEQWLSLGNQLFSSPPILFPKIKNVDTMCILFTP